MFILTTRGTKKILGGPSNFLWEDKGEELCTVILVVFLFASQLKHFARVTVCTVVYTTSLITVLTKAG